MSIDAAIACYKHLEHEFSFEALSGGNCGTAALAVCKKLADAGLDSSLAFVTSEVATSYQDVYEQELDLYHVALEFGGVYVDCAGKQDRSDLLEIAPREYGEHDAQVFDGLKPCDAPVHLAITHDTDWGIAAGQFYEALRALDLNDVRAATPTP